MIITQHAYNLPDEDVRCKFLPDLNKTKFILELGGTGGSTSHLTRGTVLLLVRQLNDALNSETEHLEEQETPDDANASPDD